MAIALANQSAGVLGTAANTWNYTLGFTPTVGRQLAVFTLTPASAGATAFGWSVSQGGTNFSCVGTRTGVTGSYNISCWVGPVTSTSTTIGMFFGSTSLHGVIVAEFSGWSTISPIATLTNTTTLTASTLYTGLAAPGGRDLITTGTNSLQVRSVISFNPNTLVNWSPTATGATSDITVSGTPGTTITNAPGGSTWFEYSNVPSSVTGTSLNSTTANWNTGPSGGQMATFTLVTGSSLNGQSAAWSLLTNPAGISNSLVRICYRLGTSLNNVTNTLTSSSSSAMNAASVILGEKSLVTRTASSSDTITEYDSPYKTDTIYSSYSYNIGTGIGVYSGTVSAGAALVYVQDTDSRVVNASHLIFTNGSSWQAVPISYVSDLQSGDGYAVGLNGVVPTVAGQSTWTSATFVKFPTINFKGYPSIAQAFALADSTTASRINQTQDTLKMNYVQAGIEFGTDPSTLINDYGFAFDYKDPTTFAISGIPTAGDTTLYIESDDLDWIQPGMQVMMWNYGTGNLVGPYTITGGGIDIDRFGNPNGFLYFTIDPELAAGQTTSPLFPIAFLIPSTATLQDFLNLWAVYPQVLGVPDPIDGSTAPFLGGFI